MHNYRDNSDDPDDFDEYSNIRVKQRTQPKPDRKIKRTGSQLRAELTERESALLNGRNGKGEVTETLKPAIVSTEAFFSLVEEDRSKSGFNPTFGGLSGKNHVSKHEREWILNYLGNFYEEHLISDVLRRVKGGKEATVYCCQAHPSVGESLLAGKVYHERMFRSLKNDALYRQGRNVLDIEGKRVRGKREARAMFRKTDFGQGLLHTAWLSSEFMTMRKLHDAGVDVPKPFAQNDNAMLMEYMGDDRNAAPALHEVRLPSDEAKPLFERMMHNIELMLINERVHGDLSAYNVLYWEGEVKIIDFPQAIDPYINKDAYWILERDVTRICQYFGKYGIRVDASQITSDFWEKHVDRPKDKLATEV